MSSPVNNNISQSARTGLKDLIERFKELTTPPQITTKQILLKLPPVKNYTDDVNELEFGEISLNVKRIKWVGSDNQYYYVVYETEHINYYLQYCTTLPDNVQDVRKILVNHVKYYDCDGQKFDEWMDEDCYPVEETIRYQFPTKDEIDWNQVYQGEPKYVNPTKEKFKELAEKLFGDSMKEGYLTMGGHHCVIFEHSALIENNDLSIRIGKGKVEESFYDEITTTIEKRGYFAQLYCYGEDTVYYTELENIDENELEQIIEQVKQEEKVRKAQEIKKIEEVKPKIEEVKPEDVIKIIPSWADGVYVRIKAGMEDVYYIVYPAKNGKYGWYTSFEWRDLSIDDKYKKYAKCIITKDGRVIKVIEKGNGKYVNLVPQ